MKSVGGSTPKARLAYRSAMLLSNEFASDPEANSWTKLLVFASARDWEKMLRLPRVLGVKTRTSSEGTSKTPSSGGKLYSGFTRLIRYMEDFQVVRAEIGMLPGPDQQPSKELDLGLRIHEMQQWRLDFHDEFVFRRFLDLLRVAKTVLSYEAPGIDVRVFEERVRILMTDWGAPAMVRGVPA